MKATSATQECHPAPEYHAGRLMALCQHIQDLTAPTVNRTYSDSYFRAACQNPRAIVPRVVTVARTRMRQIERGDQRRDIDNLLTRLFTEFESDLPGTGQTMSTSLFQLGYFHQRADLPTKAGYGTKRYLTASGDVVMSLGERLIADLLYDEGILFDYELPLIVPDAKTESGHRQIHPDFTVVSSDGMRTLLIEHCGMLGDEKYDRNWASKRSGYTEFGASWVQDIREGAEVGTHSVLQTFPEDLRSAKRCRQILVEAIQLTTGNETCTSRNESPF